MQNNHYAIKIKLNLLQIFFKKDNSSKIIKNILHIF